MLAIAQGVHGLPETVVPVGGKLTVSCQGRKGLLLPEGVITFDALDHGGLQHKETTIDPTAVALWFFLEGDVTPFIGPGAMRVGGYAAIG